MSNMIRFALPLILVAVAIPAEAGRYNKVLSIGDQAPSWQDLPGTDDAKHSLADLADKEVLVVAITCNSCPYAMDAEDHLVAMQRKYRDRGVSVVAISASQHHEDGMEAMKERAKEKGFEFPYLLDESQQIGRDFGAKYTPEFYVLNKERQVVYMGALTDSFLGKTANKQYVESAIDALLSGQKIKVEETAPVGCAIRYQRVRRKRKLNP